MTSHGWWGRGSAWLQSYLQPPHAWLSVGDRDTCWGMFVGRKGEEATVGQGRLGALEAWDLQMMSGAV